ncbi:MAG: gliding motility lipoprotein GldH, partial [Phocaeicola sp.]
MNLLKASKLIYIGVLAVLTACQNSTIYHAYQPVPLTGWEKHDTLFYTPTLTAGSYEIEVALRHHEKYPFQNLWVELSYAVNDTTSLPKDSVGFTLTNKDGKWNGIGVSSLYQLTYPNKITVNISEGDTLNSIYISHIMRDVVLEGITDIG